ncbi:FMN-dependent monooxygenase [Bosea caraganae]|uniref:FMN-dependent monooxygenase n=1 Tax=Bosea caraganae TaxID=2763117 RepID=A0A370L8V5_9HYPH|nr:LLM class flavin-dependent oxidoreductase [Bosea caraganae]RDJ26828.1 FMN-dependent monooxygenase [Bosea caraganae]RDJ30714.1 FMN-dependent monooxygenase [Bosea caraganae]
MSTPPRTDKLKLGAFFHPTGNHVAAWLHPQTQIDAGTNFAHYVEMAGIAERGKFDLMFLADAVATRDGNLEALSRWPQYMNFLDPLTLLAGLTAVTTHLGLVATATTSYNEPYQIARRLASFDHMTGGRVGWNVVTSANTSEAYNFGRDEHYAHGERYDRAEEFVEVVKGLWDSYDDGAFVRDRETGRYFKPEALHFLRHQGEHFKVRGPLHIERSPQGHPVIAQASASAVGTELAGRIAEIVFTPLHSLAQGQQIYQQLKDLAVKNGRTPDDIKIMPGLNAIVGRTEAEAQEKHAALQALIHPDVGRELLQNALRGMDLSPYRDDEPFPDEVVAGLIAQDRRRYEHMLAGKPTVREIYQKFAGARGQRTLIGSPTQVADDIEYWFANRAVDGFLIQPADAPGGLDDFVTLVVPELQRRGLFRTEYEGRTLRENLGLRRPPSRYA